MRFGNKSPDLPRSASKLVGLESAWLVRFSEGIKNIWLTMLSLLAWGWLNHNGLVTMGIMLLIVLSKLTTWRWDMKIEQFYRIGDFVMVLFVAVLVYFSVVHTQQRPVFIVLEWLPLFFLPILLVQLYSVKQQLPVGTLFYSQRKRKRSGTLDFTRPYATICWLAAGVVNDISLSYFLLSIVGFSAILWSVRSKNSPLILWLIVIALSAGLSYWGQQGLRQLHAVFTEQIMEWVVDWQRNPFKSTTSIGDIGELKLSDRIEFRVKADKPLLLMQASYDRYIGQSWLATLRVFNEKTGADSLEKHKNIKQLEVFQTLKSTTILALPAGTVRIKGLEGATLQYTPLGAVKLSEAPDYINFQVNYTGQQVNKVREFDLQVPVQHQAWIALIKQDLNLEQQDPATIAQAITQYFKRNYYYSLFLGREPDADKALKEFILHRKAGHCEYFAVASVFLLRSYGIPARLANGYAMQEYNAAERLYIVRRRHAHAWAIAQIDGYWQAVDATPAQWLEMEEEQAELFQPVYDFFSDLYFKYKHWRYLQALAKAQDNEQQVWWIVGGVLLVILAWRLLVSRRDLVHLSAKQDNTLLFKYPGQDSELFMIEKALAKTDNARMPNESVIAWAQRIDSQALLDISKMHYRYRFAAERFTIADRNRLKQAVKEWLALHG